MLVNALYGGGIVLLSQFPFNFNVSDFQEEYNDFRIYRKGKPVVRRGRKVMDPVFHGIARPPDIFLGGYSVKKEVFIEQMAKTNQDVLVLDSMDCNFF